MTSMRVPIAADDPRSEERIRAHYEIERALAQRLRTASKTERRTLYNTAYEDLYRLVPDHPSSFVPDSPEAREAQVAKLLRRLGRWLGPERTFLEIGPGDCAFAFAAAARAKHVYAVDVCDHIVDRSKAPPNFDLIISDGTSIPAPDASVDFAFSDQLMEHLHPDDALDQLREIHRVLKPRGEYLFFTPNRLSGPHDVSMFYSDVAEGFHLREYTARELGKLLRGIGFRRVRLALPLRGTLVMLPLLPFAAFETLLGVLPARLRKSVANWEPVRRGLFVRLLATK
jgi:SAM-dependent methyltransferase